MTVDDINAAIELVKHMHYIPASFAIAEMLGLNLDMAYDLVCISRERN